MGGPIKIGSVTIDTIGQLKVGSFNVQQAYVGSVLVFPATTTTTTTTSTTSTTSTTTSTTTAAPTTTTSTTSTTTLAPTTTTSTTTSTTTEAPTTTTSTTSTTTIAPTTTTSTTTSTTTEVPTTTTTTSTTTLAPTTTTSTTTSTTTEAPTTTTTTTLAPTTTTSTTSTTTTEAPTVYSYSIWTKVDSTSPYDGADSAANACTFLTSAALGLQITVYSTSATFQNGMTLFTDASLSTAFVAAAAPDNYFRHDISSVRHSFRYSSSVTELTACPVTTTTTTTTSTTTSTTTEAPTTSTTTTTTTTTAYYTFGLGVDPTSFSGACIEHGLGTLNYYAAVSTLANGVVLYQDSALSTVVPDNYYSDGVNSWLVTGGDGILTSQKSCTPINMVLAATYTGVSEMSIDLNISSAIPDSATFSFNWCTDSGASGFAEFIMNSGTTGDISIPSINLSSTGNNTNSTAWGSYSYVVLESSGTTVNQFNVKTLSIGYSTADTTKTVILDYPSVDDACANAAPVADYCIYGC